MPDIAEVRELAGQLDALVPYPKGSPRPASALVRHYAAETMIRSARFALSSQRSQQWDGIPDVDLVASATAAYAAAVFLRALQLADPEAANETAAKVIRVCESGEIGEMAWAMIGEPEAVAELAQQIAVAAAEPDEIAAARDQQRRRDVDAWRAGQDVAAQS